MAEKASIKTGAAQCPTCDRTIANPPGLHATQHGSYPDGSPFEMDCPNPDCEERLLFQKLPAIILVPEKWVTVLAHR